MSTICKVNGLECSYCNPSCGNRSIELKNIDLSKVPRQEQVERVVEEFQEFWTAYNNKDRDNLKEEFFDVMQSMLGLMHKEGITAEEVMESYSKHLEKIKNRPREVEE